AFLAKPTKSEGFEQIIDFLNAKPIKYALTVNPIIYTSCIKQFWATAKVKKVNGKDQIQALVDKQKVIISEESIRSDIRFDDAEGTKCLPNDAIFEGLARIGYEKTSQRLTFYKAFFSPQWKFLIHTILQCLSAKTTTWNEFSSTMASTIICIVNNQRFNFSKYILVNMVKNLEGGVKFFMFPRFLQVFLDKQVKGMSKHKETFNISCHTKKVFTNMKRQADGFSRNITPLFDTMMVQVNQEKGVESAIPIDSHQTLIIDQPSTSSRPRKKQLSRIKQRTYIKVPLSTPEIPVEESVPTSSNDPLPSGEDSIQLNKLMVLCTSLQTKVLDLETAKTAQAKEITTLKKRVKKLEGRKRSRLTRLRILRKIGASRRVESSEEKESLGDQENSSKQGRSIEDLDADAKITLINETQDDLVFDAGVLDDDAEQGIKVKEVEVSTAEVVTTVSDSDPVPTTIEVVTTVSALTTTDM
ncbi:hypothetical protein Tco_1261264, partial [Tanacetum coccineum]